MSAPAATWAAKAWAFLVHEFKLILPPTIYFFCAFNVIVFTTNLLVLHYWFALSHFLFATTMALIVGKVILVTHRFAFLERFRDAPLVWPILFKTVFYTVVVALVRLLEVFIRVVRDERGMRVGFDAAVDAFTWERFTVIQTWLFVCFLIYVAFRELATRLGAGELMHLWFQPRR